MSDETSHSLLERLRDPGDNLAWERFTSIYEPLIEGWLRRQGVQTQDAADVRQEVMSTVFAELPHFEHNGHTGAFRSWLRKITAYCLKRFWRSRRRHERGRGEANIDAMADQLADPHSELSQAWDREHDRYLLHGQLALVRDQFQPNSLKAFEQVALQQRDERKVAEELDLTVNAVRIALSRVSKALREVRAGLID